MTSTTPQEPSRVAVVSASARAQRVNPAVTAWVVEAIEHLDGFEIDLIDLAHAALPDDSLLNPGGEPKTELADRIGAATAFVFVTPEYNASYPATLKRLIDWHYAEWQLKPVLLVGYGLHGGHAAIEHLRGVMAELNAITTRRVIGLPTPWQQFDEEGRFTPDADVTKALHTALGELHWWTEALTSARTSRPFPG
ncbi:hypothetical protein AD006_29965 (plasmid) [Pseudonocardia sp. EC080610-09]|nr:hypothetical protein AD006_29965 [Pseudonocardia sp. EC080610-09]ALL85787.1 hypothetical protein AD017_31285 [Pseudonocardia sp. EC080619-01]